VGEFIRRVAWYFGVKVGVGPQAGDRVHSSPSPVRRAAGCVVVGAVFALITDAIAGFDLSVGALVFRAGALAIALGLWSLIVERWSAAEERQL
jgi:hypothetical protein